MKRRVVITGRGGMCSLGANVQQIFEAMKAGQSGISALDFLDVERLSTQIGGQIHNYHPDDYFESKLQTLLDRYAQFAMIAADEAIFESQILQTHYDPRRIGVIIGTSGGGLGTQNMAFRQVFEEHKNRVHPFTVPRLMNNSAGAHISMKHGFEGVNFTVSSACASSNHAMAQAAMMIETGLCDVMISGGAESMLCFGGLKAWEGLRVMSNEACRPFSKDRNGMVQGEGAGIFVLEDYEHARKRGAMIFAELAGYGMTADAGDIVTPNQKGAEQAMNQALKSAKLNPEDIGYINAHGTATQINDKTEAQAIRAVFDNHLPLVSSTKSMHGHLIGGAGGVEALACLMALDGIAPPTINHNEIDEEIGLDVIPNFAREISVNAVLSNALAFGGLNAVLAFQKI